MTALALKVMATPMAPYLELMEGMSLEQKLSLVAFLIDMIQQEERKKTSDEEFVNELLSLRYDGGISTDEMKQVLRESRHFGDRNIKLLYDEE